MSDQVTVLTCAPGKRATKLIAGPDDIRPYAAGIWYSAESVEVDGIGELAALLSRLEHEPRRFVIRASLIEGRDPRRVRRTLYQDKRTGEAPFFESCPRPWFGADFDHVALPEGVSPVDLDRVAEIARASMPEPFRWASCWAQLTTCGGIKPGGRIRLWFWLSRPATGAELKRLLKGTPGLDFATLNAVSPNYVAAPIFRGFPDPVPVRSGLIEGELSIPQIPEPGETQDPSDQKAFPRARRKSENK